MKAMNVGILVCGVVALLLAGSARADDCEIINGSFELDGYVEDVTAQEPNGWTADIPAGKFKGYIYTDWATEGFFNLTLHSEWKTFEGGETATVSQPVSLVNVERIVFDLKLDKQRYPYIPAEWDPNEATAVVMIDGEVVWDSDGFGPDVRGEHTDVVYLVEEKYRSEGPHLLSLGLRINEAGSFYGRRYVTFWDMVECDFFCGGAGPMEGDIDGDCCVDINDLKLLAGLWLSEAVDPNDKANLFRGDDDLSSFAMIDFRDFANYAAVWAGDMAGLAEFAASWLTVVDPDYEYNLFHGDDVRPKGRINFFDFAILGDKWLACNIIEGP